MYFSLIFPRNYAENKFISKSPIFKTCINWQRSHKRYARDIWKSLSSNYGRSQFILVRRGRMGCVNVGAVRYDKLNKPCQTHTHTYTHVQARAHACTNSWLTGALSSLESGQDFTSLLSRIQWLYANNDLIFIRMKIIDSCEFHAARKSQ